MKHLRTPYLILYFLGTASVLGSDLLVAAAHEEVFVAAWAEVRSLVGIVGVFCLVGLEQVLVRSPRSSARLMWLLTLQVPLLAAPVALVVHGAGYLSSLIQAYLLTIASAWTVALYQYFRSHNQRNMAQLTQQGWRIVLFGIIAALLVSPAGVEIGDLVVTVMLVIVAIAAVGALVRPPSYFCPQDPEPIGALYRIGGRFMVTSSLLALAVYAEQLLVIQFGATEDSAHYFTHATFFLFPISVLNGYAGFLLGPWVRDNHDRFVDVLRRNWKLVTVGVAAVALILNAIGHIGWRILSPSAGNPSLALSLIFATCGIMTSLYQIPSAYNGQFAHTKHHDALILAQLGALGCAIGAFWLCNAALSVPVVVSVAVASLVNWTLRAGSGMAIVALVARSRMD